MSISFTVTRKTPGALDRYGDAATSTTATHTVDAFAVAPAESQEPSERGRQGVIVNHTAYFLVEPDIRHDDTLTTTDENFAGTYTVEGNPAKWVDPFSGGGLDGVVVNLRRTEG